MKVSTDKEIIASQIPIMMSLAVEYFFSAQSVSRFNFPIYLERYLLSFPQIFLCSNTVSILHATVDCCSRAKRHYIVSYVQNNCFMYVCNI